MELKYENSQNIRREQWILFRLSLEQIVENVRET